MTTMTGLLDKAKNMGTSKAKDYSQKTVGQIQDKLRRT